MPKPLYILTLIIAAFVLLLHKLRYIIILAIAVLVVHRLLLAPLYGQETGLLRVHFIDVGQGDSILIQSSNQANVLIDGGYDNGLSLAYLQSIGVSHLNALIASHPHADHIGGLTQVMQAVPVDALWTNGASHTTTYFEQFIDTIADRQIPYFEAGANNVITVGDLQFDVVSGQPTAADLNDTSLVLHLTYGGVSFLFTGDAEFSAELQMLQTIDPARLASTILKIGHHGSHTSSSPEFLRVVQPQIAIYSAGRNNDYGHPHQSTLEDLVVSPIRNYLLCWLELGVEACQTHTRIPGGETPINSGFGSITFGF
jgi:competence protein ComEC